MRSPKTKLAKKEGRVQPVTTRSSIPRSPIPDPRSPTRDRQSAIPDPRSFQERVLHFFDQHQRDLPWRHDTNPYRIWVSEIMLQQTRSETVRAYYQRWLRRFPDLNTLAAAPIDDVLKQWEGLGYYSRARNLHRAAALLREQYHGILPTDPEALRKLPGIGEYTAGAIASIAYGKRTAAIDGNVKRVLSRVLDLPSPSAAVLRDTAAALVSPKRPGDFNQGLMELGATICTPRSPKCDACPINGLCRARQNGTQLQRPARSKAAALPVRKFSTVVLLDAEGYVLISRRGETGLLSGLWEFPTIEQLDHLTLPKLKKLLTARHTFSHFIGQYEVKTARLPGKAEAPPLATLRWVLPSDLSDYAMPTAQRRIAQLISD